MKTGEKMKQNCGKIDESGKGENLLRTLCGQLAVILFPLVLFFGSAIRASRHRSVPEPAAAWTAFVWLCIGFFAMALLWLVLAVRGGWRPLPWVKHWWPAALLLALALAARLPQWNTPMMDDASLYYGSLYKICHEFEFSWAYWFEQFRLMAHTSWGLITLLAIPEFLIPDNCNAVWVGQTVLSLVTVFCVYDTLGGAKQNGRRGAFLGALAFSCGAMFLGLDTFLQLDFGCAVFIFWVMWAAYRKQYLLLVAASLLLVTSKELGIGLLAGFFLGCFVYEWRRCEAGRFTRKLKTVAGKPYLVVLAVTGIAGAGALAYYLFGSSLAWKSLEMGFQNTGAPMAHYGLDLPYACYKLFQCLTINFAWLLLLLSGVLLLCFAKKREKLQSGAKQQENPLPCMAAGGAGAALVYYLLSCVIVTFQLPRYNMPIEMLLVFLNVTVYLTVLSGGVRDAVCAGITLLLLVQSYVTIDPLMKVLYRAVEVDGPFKMCKLTEPVWGGTAGGTTDSEYLGGAIVYNYQYSYLIRGVREILQREAYDADTDVVVVGEDAGLYLGAGGLYGWNTKENVFTYEYDADTAYLMTTQTAPSNGHSVDNWRDKGMLKDKAIFIWAPRRTKTNLSPEERRAEIPDFYENVEEKQLENFPYGTLFYYTADYQRP